jgi:hypothetical protein
MGVDDSKELWSEVPSVGVNGSEEVSGKLVSSSTALEVASDVSSGVTADSTVELGCSSVNGSLVSSTVGASVSDASVSAVTKSLVVSGG